MTTIVSMGFSRDQALKALRATVGGCPQLRTGASGDKGGGNEVPSFISKTEDSRCGTATAGLRPFVAVMKELRLSLGVFLPLNLLEM